MQVFLLVYSPLLSEKLCNCTRIVLYLPWKLCTLQRWSVAGKLPSGTRFNASSECKAFPECLVLSQLWTLWNLLKQSLFKTLVDEWLIWHPLETWVGARCWIRQAEADTQKSRRLSVRILGVVKGIWVLPQLEGCWMQLYREKLGWISPAVEPAYLF